MQAKTVIQIDMWYGGRYTTMHDEAFGSLPPTVRPLVVLSRNDNYRIDSVNH